MENLLAPLLVVIPNTFLYLLACMPGLFLLLGIREIPNRFRLSRAVALAGVTTIFFAPYVADFDGVPVLMPIFAAFFEYESPFDEKYASMAISSVLVFSFSLWWALRRSNAVA